MIYLTWVVRGQLDPVFSFKDEHKSEQDFKIKYNVSKYWNAVSVGYAQLLKTESLDNAILAFWLA